MLAAGFKSQSALAEQIATDEGLDAAPKDLVNRAFRQENVSPQTIARIAKVLQIEAYLLYLSKNEEDQLQEIAALPNKTPTTPNEVAQKNGTNFRINPYLLLIIPLVFIGIWFLTNLENTPTNIQSTSNESPPLGKITLVLRQMSPEQKPLIHSLKALLGEDKQFNVIDTLNSETFEMSVDIIEKFQSDAVITLRSVTHGRHIGIQFFLFYRGQELLLWTENATTTELHQQSNELVSSTIVALKKELNLSNYSDTILPLVSSSSQAKYLKARRLLDDYESEINLRRAVDLLNSAIKKSPQFAKAYSALCESKIRLSWMGDEKSILEDAQEVCDAAQDLSAQDVYIQATSAFLLSRTGRIAESVEKYSQLLGQWSDNSNALAGLSSAALEAHRQELAEIPNAIELAIDSAKKASEIEPDFWLYHFTLANIYFLNGDILSTVKSSQTAVDLNPNELSLVNFGFFSLCKGSLDDARLSFIRALEIAPGSYLGKEYLGLTYYFLQDFQQSANYRKQALDSISKDGGAAIHQMWGNLGDSYRQLDLREQELAAYQRAIETVDRDILRGNAVVSDKIYRLYYYLQLNRLSDKQYPLDQLTDIDQQLQGFLTSEVGPSGFTKLAQVFLMKKNVEKSKLALQKAMDTCPGFAGYPDLSS